MIQRYTRRSTVYEIASVTLIVRDKLHYNITHSFIS